MRISEITQLSGIDQEIRQKLEKSEQDFFSNPDNPLMTFNPQELVSVTRDKNYAVSVTFDEQEFFYTRYLTKNDINSWLTVTGSENDHYLGHYINNNFSRKQISELEKILQNKLLKQNLKWRTVVCFIVVKFLNKEN